ncbi:hypothetical protein F2P81_015690 [Scophthalmus maximus]|uniref:Uncharacterized protein n=1 Tax=Scophthalmus maximus TaxID=52904 RepID=A0A6A4SF16_SCOMX|nr:hypothetical protein F2P81_015690 [Scophthalmus maximus]
MAPLSQRSNSTLTSPVIIDGLHRLVACQPVSPDQKPVSIICVTRILLRNHGDENRPCKDTESSFNLPPLLPSDQLHNSPSQSVGSGSAVAPSSGNNAGLNRGQEDDALRGREEAQEEEEEEEEEEKKKRKKKKRSPAVVCSAACERRTPERGRLSWYELTHRADMETKPFLSLAERERDAAHGDRV